MRTGWKIEAPHYAQLQSRAHQGIWVSLDIVHSLESLQSLFSRLSLAPGALCGLCLVLLLLSLCRPLYTSTQKPAFSTRLLTGYCSQPPRWQMLYL